MVLSLCQITHSPCVHPRLIFPTVLGRVLLSPPSWWGGGHGAQWYWMSCPRSHSKWVSLNLGCPAAEPVFLTTAPHCPASVITLTLWEVGLRVAHVILGWTSHSNICNAHLGTHRQPSKPLERSAHRERVTQVSAALWLPPGLGVRSQVLS